MAGLIIDHYERHALSWDADRSTRPWIDKPWLERFADALPDGAHILDLGCGGGAPVAHYMTGRGFHVTGLDSSPTLISLCRSRLPDQEWLVGDMRALRLNRRFDGVLAWDSFFHLGHDDQRRMIGLFAQHAGPAAILMFNSGPAHGEAIGDYRGDPLYHASLAAEEYEALLHTAGFGVVAHEVEDWQNAGGRTVWLARKDGPDDQNL